MERLVDAKTVAEYVGENVQTTYRKARDGIYPSHRTGRLVRFKLSEVDEATLKGGKDVKKDGTRRRSNLA